jgi:predicted ATP-dependent endonuclease of OLD family
MLLNTIEVQKYKRFRSKEKLKLDCGLVALLGPNEVGKSSILDAMQSLNSHTPFRTSGPSQDVTRGEKFASGDIVVEATFRLEDGDWKALAQIPETKRTKWFAVRKSVDGKLSYQIYPKVTRNFHMRGAVLNQINAIATQMIRGPESDPPTLDDQFFSQTNELSSLIPDLDAEDLSEAAIKKLQSLLQIASKYSEHQWKEAASSLAKLTSEERKQNPQDAATRILERRVPRFVMFDAQDRNLLSQYDMNAHFGNQPTQVPKALENLASVAGLNLKRVFEAAASGDRGQVRSLIDVANENLKNRMLDAWRQSDVFARIDWDANRLTVVVGTVESGFEALSERSEGLRQFVALFAFLYKQGTKDRDVILLLDEAENHLHYDAQADLVQMLAKQQLARRVVYTTHSVGCLPEDLGLGIRLVEPKGESASSINNAFWSHGIPGLSPVLIGIGAATMAFLPLRFCVLTEGATDLLLLPTLLREANELDHLGFQIAPGLAEAGEGQIRLLNNEGRRVLFLVDGDEGGDEIKKKLKAAKIPQEKIFKLSDFLECPCTIEDFVDRSVYSLAVTSEIAKSGHELSFGPPLLPTTLRANAVKEWCKAHDVPVPNKVSVAYAILEQSGEANVADKAHSIALKSLYGKLKSAFGTVPSDGRDHLV